MTEQLTTEQMIQLIATLRTHAVELRMTAKANARAGNGATAAGFSLYAQANEQAAEALTQLADEVERADKINKELRVMLESSRTCHGNGFLPPPSYIITRQDLDLIADLREQLRQMTAAFNAQENVLIEQQKLTQAVRELYLAKCRCRPGVE